MYNINLDYFNIIDSEDKAYILAWFWSRGTGRVQTKDVEILHMIKSLLEYTGPVRNMELNITNLDFRQTLKQAGCVLSKRNNQSFPIIPNDLVRHFCRGIFDSYGSICIHKNKYLNLSIVHNEEFLNGFRKHLYNLDVSTKHYYRYSHTSTIQIMITKSVDAEKFLKYLYSDCNYYLTRKFQKYHKYLQNSV